MRREEVREIYNIVHVDNLASILEFGILSHLLASDRPHKSIAKEEVQDLRGRKVIRPGRRLHEYANLYLNPRNPMMLARLEQREDLCVLRVDGAILDEEGVIISDMNAARNRAQFHPPITGLRALDRRKVFASNWWASADEDLQNQHKGIMCAEVLVYQRVAPMWIRGAYVCGYSAAARLSRAFPCLEVNVRPWFFFTDFK